MNHICCSEPLRSLDCVIGIGDVDRASQCQHNCHVCHQQKPTHPFEPSSGCIRCPCRLRNRTIRIEARFPGCVLEMAEMGEEDGCISTQDCTTVERTCEWQPPPGAGDRVQCSTLSLDEVRTQAIVFVESSRLDRNKKLKWDRLSPPPSLFSNKGHS